MIADAGYWHAVQMQAITERGIEVFIPPDVNLRDGKRPGWENGLYELMRRKLSTDRGRQRYAQRKLPSSRSTDRSNTTAALTGSCEEADPPRSRSGG